MKKIALFLIITMCFTTISVCAVGEAVNSYNTTLTISADGTPTAGGSDVITVDSMVYERVAEGTFDNQANLVLTKPGFAIAYIAFKNYDQKPTSTIPMPFSIDYECALTQQRYEADGVTKIDEYKAGNVSTWLNSGPPTFVSTNSGDFEWAFINVTQDMIDAAGGRFEVVFLVRGKIYPDYSISDLGQVYSDDFIHIYQEKDKIGNQNVTGNFIGSPEPETVYQVEILWGSMEFTYTENDTGTWNPSTHSYDDGGEVKATWACVDDSNKISIFNHSNADVNIGLSYLAKDSHKDILTEFTLEDGSMCNTFTLDAADVATGNTYIHCYLQITKGKLTPDDVDVILGTVCVTLN